MMVKARDLVDFGHGQAHFMRQRGQVRGREMVELILDFM